MGTKTIDIQKLLGGTVYPETQRLVAAYQRSLEYTNWPKQQDELDVLSFERSLLPAPSVLSSSRAVAWERCWLRHYERYTANKTVRDLVPDFLLRPPQPFRYCGKFIHPFREDMLYAVQKIILTNLLVRWVNGASALVEFGCGSGYNLALAADLFGDECTMDMVGLDWSPAAVRCVNALGFGGATFNLLEPQLSLHNTLPWKNTAVLTAGALEQLGGRFGPFLEFLLANKPRICVHVEPLLELYDPEDAFDAEAIQYHKARDYLSGFLPTLQQLDQTGYIHICAVHRTRFGARFNDGFSWVVWRPK